MKMQNQQGSILVVTIMILSVLTILSIAILTLMLNENKQALYQQRKTQAHYLARSGAEAVEKAILDMSSADEKADFNNLLINLSSGEVSIAETAIAEGKFTAQIKAVGDNIAITSTGIISNGAEDVKDIVTRVIIGTVTTSAIDDLEQTLYVGKTLIINKNPTFNDGIIASNKAIITGLAYGEYKRKDKVYPILDSSKMPVIEEKSNAVCIEEINRSIEYINASTVTFNNVIINTGNNPVDIVLSKLSINGELNITGNGKVRIFVKDAINLSSSHINKNGNYNNLEIFYYGDAEFMMNGNELNANLFIKNAAVKCDDNVKVGLIYAPASTINWYKNGEIGAVIVDELILDKNAQLSKRIDLACIDLSSILGDLVVTPPGGEITRTTYSSGYYL